MRRVAEHEQPVLKSAGGHWHYVSPGATPNAERVLARSIQETLKWLGVVDCAEGEDGGVFRITPVGVWLLTGKAERQVAEAYPERNTEIIVQPNFDIVAPSEDADPLLTVPLEQFAVRGSTGQATVYHVSKDSFTQALQDGHDGDSFVDFLVRYNRAGELPANVMTTLEDWRGGMKHVRVRTLHVLESDDSLVIADLLHRRSLKKYFSPIDPRKTVVYGKISKNELIKQLEKDGFIVK